MLKKIKYYVKCEEDKKGNKKWVKTPFVKDWLKDKNIKKVNRDSELNFCYTHFQSE